jgi:thioredoxin-related protein
MKRFFLSALPVVAMAAALHLNTFEDPLPIGAPIPKSETKLKDISGKEVSLQEAKTNKGLLVMFSCNTCPYVIKNQQRTAEVCAYAKSEGIGVAILNSNEAKRTDDDSYEAMRDYAKDQGYNWYYLVDKSSELADAFGANRTPECFLFNAEGKLVYHGAIDDNPSDPESVSRKHLLVAIDEMKSGKEISVKESRSVGCSIKRL